ncbi:MAG: polyprenol monophosphomannose synthase [Planctomycetota bacterium]|nr:polyprenol monophosphomannose synthase [Planctomycetota bacterium]
MVLAHEEEAVKRTLVVVATYNEVENIAQLVEAIFFALPRAEILVIDDNSPDGTGDWCDSYQQQDSRLRCLHRSGKLGLGSASIEGFRFAIDSEYDFVLTLDADFSHPPEHLPALLNRLNQPDCDVVVGSRYIKGGKIEGWPLKRRIMSRLVNLYARFALRIPCRDCSGAFRGYKVAVLRDLPPEAIQSQGYAYLEELLWRLKRLGCQFREVPFTFKDREFGETKINFREARQAVWAILTLGLREWTGGLSGPQRKSSVTTEYGKKNGTG